MKEILRAKSKQAADRKGMLRGACKSDTDILLSVGSAGRNRIFSEVAEKYLDTAFRVCAITGGAGEISGI